MIWNECRKKKSNIFSFDEYLGENLHDFSLFLILRFIFFLNIQYTYMNEYFAVSHVYIYYNIMSLHSCVA